MSNGKLNEPDVNRIGDDVEAGSLSTCDGSMKENVELILVNGDERTYRDESIENTRPGNHQLCPKSVMAGKVIEIVPISTNDTMALSSTLPVMNGEHFKCNGSSASYGGSDLVPAVNGFMGFGGYYTCEGHSVEDVIASFCGSGPTTVNVPLDLSSKSSQCIPENSKVDLSSRSIIPCGNDSDNEDLSQAIANSDDQVIDLSQPAQSTLESILKSDSQSPHAKKTHNIAKSRKNPNPNNGKIKRHSDSPKMSSDSEEKSDQNQQDNQQPSPKKRSRNHSRGGKREEPSQCTFCSKWFCSSWSRLSHERTHTGQNRYYCKVCHRSFPTQHNHSRGKSESTTATTAKSAAVVSESATGEVTSETANQSSAAAEVTSATVNQSNEAERESPSLNQSAAEDEEICL